jgi:hypothetical protein
MEPHHFDAASQAWQWNELHRTTPPEFGCATTPFSVGGYADFFPSQQSRTSIATSRKPPVEPGADDRLCDTPLLVTKQIA